MKLTTEKHLSPFRKALATFIREQRKFRYNNKIIKEMIHSYCCGWSALSDEMDNVSEKHLDKLAN